MISQLTIIQLKKEDNFNIHQYLMIENNIKLKLKYKNEVFLDECRYKL